MNRIHVSWKGLGLLGVVLGIAAVAATSLGGAGSAPAVPAAAWLDRPAPPAGAAAFDGDLFAKPPFLRTCLCSCGFPCTTDADCGPGGVCRAGITCCAAARPGGEAAPDWLAAPATPATAAPGAPAC